jgi:transmembrane sensor
MKYNYTKIEDFLNDDSFVQWVLFKTDNEKWNTFMNENHNKNFLIEEARQYILEIKNNEDSQTLNQQNVWNNIMIDIRGDDNGYAVVPIWRRPIFSWAASIFLLLGIGFMAWNVYQKDYETAYYSLVETIEKTNVITEVINKNDKPLAVKLEDGSVITLEKNSRLSYPIHFDKDKRMVILSGEAFFDIAKSPKRPFYVYANEVITKVLGTSFRIRAYEDDKKVTVKVKTGKVSVYNQGKLLLDDPELNALIVLPNQQAIYSRQTENLNKRLVEVPMPITEDVTSALPSKFDEVSVVKIFEIIEKRYGVKLIFNESIMAQCFITTKLNDVSLYDQLDLICEIVGATYKEVDAQILIESKGCK